MQLDYYSNSSKRIVRSCISMVILNSEPFILTYKFSQYIALVNLLICAIYILQVYKIVESLIHTFSIILYMSH